MVGAPLFSQPYLCIKPPRPSPPNMRFSTSVNFILPILPLLLNKIVLTIPNSTPFLYTSAMFHFLIFAYNCSSNLHPKYLPYLSHLANAGCVKGPRSYEQ